MTQDALASALHRHGVGWNRSMLAKVERGERRPLLEELLLVAWVLSVPIVDLLPDEGAVTLTPSATIATRAARALLSGDQEALWDLRVADLDVPYHRALVKRHGADIAQASVFQIQSPAYAEDQAADEEAERKAARRLGVVPEAVSTAAHTLWGRTLSAERERRLSALVDLGTSDRSIQALRGHVTRQLLAELAPVLDKEADQ